LRKLEAGRKGLPCEGCELLTPSNPHGYIVYEAPEGKSERCGNCGRRMWFVIEVRLVEGGGGIAIG
jgi:hypothetical protein